MVLAFSGGEEEGDAAPAFVVDGERECSEGRACRTLGDRVVVKVAWLAVARTKLAQESIVGLEGLHLHHNSQIEGVQLLIDALEVANADLQDRLRLHRVFSEASQGPRAQ